MSAVRAAVGFVRQRAVPVGAELRLRPVPGSAYIQAATEREERLGGEQSPWKERVSPRRQRLGDTTDSSTEQGLEVGRSRRLEGSARPPRWSGRVGSGSQPRLLDGSRWHLRVPVAKPASPRRAWHAAAPGIDRLVRRRFGAVAKSRSVLAVPAAGSPVTTARHGDVGVRSRADRSITGTRDDGLCQRASSEAPRPLVRQDRLLATSVAGEGGQGR